MSNLAKRFAGAPFIVKAIVVFVAVLVLYFGVYEPLILYRGRWDKRAESLETAMAREKEFAGNSGDGLKLQELQETFGSPSRPGQTVVTPEGLLRVVNAILDQHGVNDRSVVESSSTLSGDVASLGAGSIKRLVLQVSFEADSSTVIAVLADLERAPEVAAVSRVRIDKSGVRSGSIDDAESGMVRATLAPEAWIAAAGGGSGGAGS